MTDEQRVRVLRKRLDDVYAELDALGQARDIPIHSLKDR